MDAPPNQIFFPVSFHELFTLWERFPNAVPYAGGTNITRKQGKNILTLPPVILCLDKLAELHRITRTEHYLEIGAMVKLNKLIWLGKIVPEILCICLENIAGVQLRNIATIGGNICCSTRLLDSPAPLTALDAQYELRSAYSSRWVAASRFHDAEEHNVLEKQELLTRVRLPLHQWDYSVYKKFYCEDIFKSKALVFLAKTQKNILSDIRVVYKGDTILRNKNGEGFLVGKLLPLSRKTAGEFIEDWKKFLADSDEIDEFSKFELLNSIIINVNNLSE
jgi:CO/xanthine dehydrogenase FAD-binding subunit